MSCYIVENEHVKQLAGYLCNQDYPTIERLAINFAKGFERDLKTRMVESDKLATHFANALMAENYKSVSYRYSDVADSENEKFPPITVTLCEVLRTDQIPAINILTAVECLEYQSCECPNWDDTYAKRICDAIRSLAIRRLPGKSTANWGTPWVFERPASEVISISSM